MAETRPRSDQIRFISSKTGEHNLDTYLENAELGTKTIAQLLQSIFDASGNMKSDFIEFREDPGTPGQLQVRTGGNTGTWVDIEGDTFQDLVTAAQTAAGEAADSNDTAQTAATTATEALADMEILAAEIAAVTVLYLGPKTSNPTLNNEGGALTSGNLYYNTVATEMRVYDAVLAAWISITLDTKLFKVSANDTTPGDLEAKLLVEAATLTATTQNDGANETRTLAVRATQEADAAPASGTVTLNMNLGHYRKVSPTGNFTVDITPITGRPSSYVLQLVNGGAYTITWTGVDDWADGSAPDLSTSGTDLIGFIADDDGIVRGYLIGAAFA